jgi:hypothetical protein
MHCRIQPRVVMLWRGRWRRDRREVALNVPMPEPHPPDGPDDPDDLVDRGGDELAWFDEDTRDRPAPAVGDAGAAPIEGPPEALSYRALSRTPLTSLVFTLPLVLAYEGGVLLLGRGAPRNGADVWLRQALDGLGFGAYFLLPALTVLGLLAWHHVEHDRWHFSPGVLLGMAGESLLWALLLVALARLQERLWPLAVATAAWEDVATRLVGFCGAGLYEEVLFRLLMLPAAAWALRRLGASRGAALAGAILLTSTLFSAAHYVGPLGDVFEPYSFTFRVIAGIFFALVFLGRGFGIAAGTHAVYDMLVGLS